MAKHINLLRSLQTCYGGMREKSGKGDKITKKDNTDIKDCLQESKGLDYKNLEPVKTSGTNLFHVYELLQVPTLYPWPLKTSVT
jgi:hypothetical protein